MPKGIESIIQSFTSYQLSPSPCRICRVIVQLELIPAALIAAGLHLDLTVCDCRGRAGLAAVHKALPQARRGARESRADSEKPCP